MTGGPGSALVKTQLIKAQLYFFPLLLLLLLLFKMSAPQPARSSLLFSPVAATSSSGTSPKSTNNNSLPTGPTDSSVPELFQPDEPVFKHHSRRRSDFRSKSTDQIIPAVSNPSNPITSSTTLYPGPAIGNGSHNHHQFSNLNVSQSGLRPAPLAPVPIPATRFDTITSYVDIIYQHQNQQQQQQQQDDVQISLDEVNSTLSSTSRIDNNIVYLDPSDGIDGDKSFMATCPQCVMMVMTEFKPFPGNKSRRMAWTLLPVLLCWLPYYSPGRKWMDVKHFCPKCQSLIAIYRK